jgi:ribonuclease BN (tRNA processing enzyme)
MQSFFDHELIFLGTGGGRVLTSTQHRQTGGIIYKFNGTQAHIDPGPGAVVYLNQLHIDRLKTQWIIATHNHTDHINDVPIIIEALHESLNKPAGNLISTQDYINGLNLYYKNLLKEITPMTAGKTIKLTPNTFMLGTKINHGDIDGFGFIIQQINPENSFESYKIGFTSDTEMNPDFAEIFRGVDILVANVLRPNDKFCKRHVCVEEFIPVLAKIKPKMCVITHYGALFDPPWSNTNMIPSQMKYIQEKVGSSIQIIGADDGMSIKINEYL